MCMVRVTRPGQLLKTFQAMNKLNKPLTQAWQLAVCVLIIQSIDIWNQISILQSRRVLSRVQCRAKTLTVTLTSDYLRQRNV